MKLPHLLPWLALCFVSCASEDFDSVKRAAREGVLPSTFASEDAAKTYVGALFAGGLVDRVRLGPVDYLVVFQHGSGRPVLGIAVYQKRAVRWERVAQPHFPIDEFVRASVSGGRIFAVGEKSNRLWLLYAPGTKD